MTSRRRTFLVAAAALVLQTTIALIYLNSRAAGPGFGWKGVPLDDVWIHFVYARNIAQGHPFQYNPGEWETGASSPLWALILALPALLGIPLVAAAKILGLLLAAAGAATGYRIAARLDDERGGFIFAGALAITPYFSFASVSGTEVPLFVFLMLAALLAALERRWRLAGGAAGLAVLARPEGYVLLPFLALAGIRDPSGGCLDSRIGIRDSSLGGGNSREPEAWPRRAIEMLIPFAIAVVPWVVYCLAVTGRPLPSTFYLKSHWYGLFNPGQFRKIGALLFAQPFVGGGFRIPAVAVICAIGGTIALGFGARRLSRIGLSALILIGLAGPAFLYAISIGHPLGALKGPDEPGSTLNFYIARYLLPGIAPLLLLWAIGLSEIARARRWIVLLALSLVVLPVAGSVHQHALLSGVYSWNCENIEEQQVAAARWIAANVPNGARIGVSDAGAIRYLGGHDVIDMAGLNTHRLVPLLRAIATATPESPEEERLREEFWRMNRPDYLAVTGGWHRSLLHGIRADILRSFDLKRNTICGGAELIIAHPVPPVR